MHIRELKPITSQKSFYGKATVLEENGTETLFSYGTPIVRREQNGEYTCFGLSYERRIGEDGLTDIVKLV